MKKSKATVTIGTDAKILAGDVIGIYATAVSDSSAQAGSQLFSVGFSHAEGDAEITIATGALIEAGGPVNITSDGSATRR